MRVLQLLCTLIVTSFAATTTLAGSLGLDAGTILTIANVGAVVADVNNNLMKALTQDPSQASIASDCIAKTADASVAINSMFNLNNYEGWTSVINFLNVTMIKVMNQFNNCGMNTYLAKIDEAVSTISRASGMGANAAAQVAYYYASGQKDFKPAVIKSWEDIIAAGTNKQWGTMAQGIQLFFSQLVKFEANDKMQEVKGMNQ